MSELERVDEELEEWDDPLDALPPALRDYAKAVRAMVIVYVLARRADKVTELLEATTAGFQRVADEARSGGAGAG